MNTPGPNRDVALFSEGRAREIGLTYEPYYRLTQKPFSLFADPRFLYKSAVHAPVFDDLLGAIRRREGLIVVTGDIGMGKTTLCRAALEHLDRKTFSAFVPDPFMSREDLLKTLLIDFGVISIDELRGGQLQTASRLELSYVLYEFLDSLVPLQAVAVVVVDEAQNLSVPLLEEVRILSELVGREKLLQVVLVGQIELAEKLKLPQMRQLDQRVTMRCTLTPLSEEEVGRYIAHRLHVAGGGNATVAFAPDALRAVYQISHGVPRLINLLCDRSLHECWRAKVDSVRSNAVHDAAARLGLTADDPIAALSAPLSRAIAIEPTPIPDEPTQVRVPDEPNMARIAEVFETVPALGEQPIAEEPPQQPDQPLGNFLSEEELKVRAEPQPRVNPAIVVALGATVSVLAGGLTLYFLARGNDVRNLELPSPPPRPSLSQSWPGVPQRVAASTAANGDQPARASSGATAPDGEESYGIQIASLKEVTRAQRLIDELAAIGVNARAVERDLGAAGLWYQVVADGYASIETVQVDLERIQQLPGYSDARFFRYRRQS
jgi:type II secretory pathway predicted ATPase ExeA